MDERFSRTRLLLGDAAMDALAAARVAVFGVGGVGGYVCEALARSGVGALELIDDDRVSLSNLNRQIIATEDTLGQYKVDVMKARILSINPKAEVIAHRRFILPENAGDFPFETFDFIVDAVDTVAAKLTLVERAEAAGVPIISAMGAGNKLDPSRFRVSDISETRVCPLARVMRRELKKRGIRHLKVVWSDEPPLTPAGAPAEEPIPAGDVAAEKEPGQHPGTPGRRSTPGSTAFVPAVAGLMIAGEVVRELGMRN
ncbi:MAG: tRNA threonylcarbamoyladenosine dehydratase [Clostridia bacterium]|nr:tRNA threonylcarbamoyladenosine dehydratase [Clostridia bacterium]